MLRLVEPIRAAAETQSYDVRITQDKNKTKGVELRLLLEKFAHRLRTVGTARKRSRKS